MWIRNASPALVGDGAHAWADAHVSLVNGAKRACALTRLLRSSFNTAASLRANNERASRRQPTRSAVSEAVVCGQPADMPTFVEAQRQRIARALTRGVGR
jgi:hypothetical protein